MKSSTESFSVTKRVKSFGHALRGIRLFLKTTHNAWIQVVLFALALGLGFYFTITETEWLVLILMGALVLSAEAFNTALEIDMDLTSPEYHPAARDTKDVAAGAVLIASCFALLVGLIIFTKYFFLH